MDTQMIEVLRYTKINRNKTIGLVDIRIPAWGVIIRKIAHLQNSEKKWFNFPTFSEEQPDGKSKFYNYFQFELEMHSGKFFEQLSQSVKEFCEKHNIEDPRPLDLSEALPF